MPNRSLKPVERPLALGEQVYNALRAQLRSGAIGAGQALQEVSLAEQLGVSRTPVREAMARLASEGLLAADRRSFTVPALTRRTSTTSTKCASWSSRRRCAASRR